MKRSELAAPRCPGSLKEGFSTYCPAVLRNVFQSKQVFHVLSLPASDMQWESSRIIDNQVEGQHRYRMKLVKNQLLPDPKGDYLLKTVFPGSINLRFPMEQTANEHLYLQLASQVFQIDTIKNALLFFPDGQPALIHRYYPVMNSFDDLESLYKNHHHGKSGSYYRQYAILLQSLTSAKMVATERYFTQILFAWLMTNGNVNAKSFGVIKSERGDFVLTPIFTGHCTRLHEMGPEFLLQGLFEGDKNTPEFRENGNYTRNEFTTFAKQIGMIPQRTEKIIDGFVERKDRALTLIEKAFLPVEAKAIVRFNFLERLSRLR